MLNKGEYEFGLANYFLHELGNNLCDEDSAIKNENNAFNNKLSEEERIILEINKIKKITDKYDNYLDIKKDNIKEIIVFIDLLLGIKISFKTSFINIVDKVLCSKELIDLTDLEFESYDETIKCYDSIFENVISSLLDSICT